MGFNQWDVSGCDCSCSAPSTKICVKACGGVAVVGATVQLWSGATLVDSCTTDATGCCTFTDAGTFDVKVIASGDTTDFGNKTLSGTTINLSLAGGTSTICCSTYSVPKNLTLTDALGTLALTYAAGSSPPTWLGCRSVNVSSCTASGSPCVINAPAVQPIAVCYTMRCNAGSSPHFTMERTWGWVVFGGVNHYYSSSGTPCADADLPAFAVCDPGAPALCSGGVDDSSDDGVVGTGENPTSTSPFAIAFTLSYDPGNSGLADPVGGNVTVSQ